MRAAASALLIITRVAGWLDWDPHLTLQPECLIPLGGLGPSELASVEETTFPGCGGVGGGGHFVKFPKVNVTIK